MNTLSPNPAAQVLTSGCYIQSHSTCLRVEWRNLGHRSTGEGRLYDFNSSGVLNGLCRPLIEGQSDPGQTSGRPSPGPSLTTTLLRWRE